MIEVPSDGFWVLVILAGIGAAVVLAMAFVVASIAGRVLLGAVTHFGNRNDP